MDMDGVQSRAPSFDIQVDDYTTDCVAKGRATDNLTVLIFQPRLGLNERLSR